MFLINSKKTLIAAHDHSSVPIAAGLTRGFIITAAWGCQSLSLCTGSGVNLGLTCHVKFLGYVKDDDVPALYKLARGFVFPSLLEGFGLPAIEAMACGTPVITSNTSSLPEIVEDAAVQVNPYDVKDIANAIVQLLNDQSLRQTLIKKGLSRAQQFTWERTAEKLLGLLRSF